MPSRAMRLDMVPIVTIVGMVCASVSSLLLAQPPAPPSPAPPSPAAPSASAAAQKASSYAPVADLTAQVDYYLGRASEALANPADYDEAKQSRVHKDGSTLAVLLLVLGNHDEANKYQGKAAGLVHAAEALAAGSEDYAKAKPALDELNRALAAGQGESAAWGEVAEMAPLMKQVPVVNNALRRSLEPARFKKQSAQVAQQAATLAAIAQAAQFNTSAVASAADTAKWQAFCLDMRDAAGALNQAAHAGDQPAASAAAKRLALSCDKCHAVFRQ